MHAEKGKEKCIKRETETKERERKSTFKSKVARKVRFD